jgi:hypothetical protein
MAVRRRQPARRTWAACLLLACLVSCETLDTGAARPPAAGAAFLRQLEQAFPDLLYHGAYLEDETGYLVISLRVHPGRLAALSARASSSLDLVLARLIIDGLYDRRFAAHLAANPEIEGVTVLVTWDGCRRILQPGGRERVLLVDGISEYDRFDVGRGLYFSKINWMDLVTDPLAAGKLFDNILFSHVAGDSYKHEPFHEQQDVP